MESKAIDQKARSTAMAVRRNHFERKGAEYGMAMNRSPCNVARGDFDLAVR